MIFLLQLNDYLTKPEYKITFKNNKNSIRRNSNCTFGGDELFIFVTNPRENIITGIEIQLIPQIPNQNLGKEQNFSSIIIEELFENFDSDNGISTSIDVVPEYSYSLKVSLKTDFGKLTPSDTVIIAGEFETMMKSVGCYIRNDYTNDNDTTKEHKLQVNTAIDCATACFESPDCKEGWSYLIGTKECYFVNVLDQSILQPGALLLENDYRIGWATGRKSCTIPGLTQNNSLIFLNRVKEFRVVTKK